MARRDRPRPVGSLEHNCRVDDPKYKSVSEWYANHQGRVPVVMAWRLSRYVKEHGCTFGDAYTALLDRGAIILIEEERRA
jgi:hypothetical protein